MINVKKNGSYYTPKILADFIICHIFKNYKFKENISLLEPSVGDGVFLSSFFNNETFSKFKIPKNIKSIKVDAVERDGEALDECKKNINNHINQFKEIKYFERDYLEFQEFNQKKYDLIIGNPPYIKNQYLTDKQTKICESIHKKSKLSQKKIKNIWTSFLISGVQSLNDNGVICFVLPAEILQVIYAKEIRNFLKDNFQRIEIFAFNELIFPKIQQDVVILICAKKQQPGVSFYQVATLNDLKKPTYVTEHCNIHRQTLDKWTNYILSDSDLKILDCFKNRLFPIKNYCKAEVGIVTAVNNFFIITKKNVQKYKLNKVALPILQKSSLMPHTVKYSKLDYEKINKSDKPSCLLAFKDKNKDFFSKNENEYFKKGEALGLDKRYKCLKRNNWYSVPSIWVPDGFFTKRSDLIPKIAINEASVMVTDAFYRIKMNEQYKIKDLIFSFYNTLTLIFSELEGRFYGGGVLELTPNEFKNLSIPYCQNIPISALSELDTLLRSNSNMEDILNYTDKIILKKRFGLSDNDIKKLRKIYFKLLKRRLK